MKLIFCSRLLTRCNLMKGGTSEREKERETGNFCATPECNFILLFHLTTTKAPDCAHNYCLFK